MFLFGLENKKICFGKYYFIIFIIENVFVRFYKKKKSFFLLPQITVM